MMRSVQLTTRMAMRGPAIAKFSLAPRSARLAFPVATKSGFRLCSKEAAAGGAKKTGWWHSAEFWGGMGAAAGWGMTGAAIYDGVQHSPEVISLKMSCVLFVYSSLFARWAFVVKPQNLFLASCHAANICAQTYNIYRVVTYKLANGLESEVTAFAAKCAGFFAGVGACIMGGPMIQSAVVGAELGVVSTFANAAAGPFTVHFWAPMSKWLISGASLLEYDRPIEKVSIANYTALTLTGFFFSRYSLLVTPINYMLCSVNIALFSSSFYHLSRKIKADYID